jgi:hypothetical protein
MHANPFIQMRLQSEEANIWQADDLHANRVFKVSSSVVKFILDVEIVGFEEAKSRLLQEGKADQSKVNTFVSRLANLQMLVTAERRSELEKLYRRFFDLDWTQSPAWRESLQYFMAGYDFPFADYSPEASGRKEVSGRMHRYASAERDSLRFKQFDAARILASEALPPPLSAIKSLSSYSINSSFEEQLRDICAAVFGMTKKVKLAWDGEKLFRRTSPSGGSRHPSEGYLLLNKSDTAYHVRAEGPFLDTIAKSEGTLAKILPTSSHQVDGAILFSSRFERNMFRYREPRTFRTVHMDVGHLMATAVRYMQAAQFTDIGVVNSLDHREFSNLCGADHFEEGLIAALTFKAPVEVTP